MATRRMFSKTIARSSKFLRMPSSTRLLYYDLGMDADDDGFVEWYAVITMTRASEQDLQVLQANGFVQIFDDKVLLVSDWKENNYLRSDRYTPSKYLKEYEQQIGENLVYQVATNGTPLVDGRYTQDRLGKDRKEQDITNVISIEKNEVFLSWEETIAPVTTTIETQRKSSVTLLNRYGLENCQKMVRVVAHAHSNQFARKEVKVQSLTALLGNWDKLVIYAKTQSSQKPKLVSV